MSPDTQRMSAAVLYGKEQLRIERVQVPKLERGDVLVRVRAALTCGTDVKVFRRGYHAKMIRPPALFGHELAGDVAAVGSDVAGFHVGQRVVAANSAPCGACYYCERGQENLCEDLLFNNGAYAEYIRIPNRIVEKNLHEIPAHVSYQDAALVEPLACVMRGLEETGVKPGDTVAVIGLGPIGMMFVRLAKAVYNARVIAIGRRRSQLDRAAGMGADEVVLNEEGSDVVTPVHKLTGGRGADIVIEAVGLPEVWQLAIKLLRRGGVVNFFGGCPEGTDVPVDAGLLHYSELTLKASFHHTPALIRQALDIISRGRVTARDLVNRVEPLSNLLEVMQHLMSHNGHLKTAIIP
ncbi:MAG TPA: alcohol dehydrogenase catalytic domain-containing protein [Bryobacteraceae bacterium]|jgi:L-iditol 2-dehydrogenase|nr:alcohol dehydrogenase catalytic domain-containing protein [Bryobacteraceae bacterium]